MQVLLTERAGADAEAAAQALVDAGHVVRFCHDEHDPVHCVADVGGRCPLEHDVVDAVLAVHAGDDGGRCGVRHHVPVTVAGSSPGDTVAGVVAAANQPLCAHSIAATDVFRRSLETAGLPGDATVDVRRRNGYLRVTIEAPFVVPATVAQKGAVRICQVLREMDSTARGIDVASPTLVDGEQRR
jgi:hypothetical protein